jgi:hypothetical protein
VKASQSSLYRELENLMLWFIPIGNNIPNDFALRKLGERMQNEMLDITDSFKRVVQKKKYKVATVLNKRNTYYF